MLNDNITKNDYYLRLCVVVLTAIFPFMCLFLVGYESSISNYWNTPIQPLFILVNAASSHHLITVKGWRVSSALLVLLTAFSVEKYGMIHNVFAILFFIACAISLFKASRFKFLFWIYLGSLLILPFSILYAEIMAIVTMCAFHLAVLYKAYIIHKQRYLNQSQHQV